MRSAKSLVLSILLGDRLYWRRLTRLKTAAAVPAMTAVLAIPPVSPIVSFLSVRKPPPRRRKTVVSPAATKRKPRLSAAEVLSLSESSASGR